MWLQDIHGFSDIFASFCILAPVFFGSFHPEGTIHDGFFHGHGAFKRRRGPISPYRSSCQLTYRPHLPVSCVIPSINIFETLVTFFCCALLGWQMSHFKSVSIVWEECVTGISRFVKAPLERFYLRMIVRWSLS